MSYSITVNINPCVRAGIEEIPDQAWVLITYPDGGKAEVASFAYSTGRGPDNQPPKTVRMVVRRTRLTGEQAALWPDWRYHVLDANRPQPVVLVDREHRHRAVVELAIRDLKEGAGLSHVPQDTSPPTRLACLRRASPQSHPLDQPPLQPKQPRPAHWVQTIADIEELYTIAPDCATM